MKNYLLPILFFFISSTCIAQKIHKEYSFYSNEEGSVYFIHPQKGFKSKDKEVVKDFIYDITYLSTKDSASFTFTYFTENILKADSLTIVGAGGSPIYTGEIEMYFVQPYKGKIWQHRGNLVIPYDILVQLYQNESPYSISLNGRKTIHYEMKAGTWKKQSSIVLKIFDVIKYNK